jgi:hypothetical protein
MADFPVEILIFTRINTFVANYEFFCLFDSTVGLIGTPSSLIMQDI